MKKKEVDVLIPSIKTTCFEVTIVGDAPLLTHHIGKSVISSIIDPKTGQPIPTKKKRDPWLEFCEALYWISEAPGYPTAEDIESAKFGFPIDGIFKCMVDASYQQGIIKKKTTAKGAIQFLSNAHKRYALIDGSPAMQEDAVRLSGITRALDVRYRPVFKEWEISFLVQANLDVFSPAQIVSMLNYGGFCNGIGDWRPQCGGAYGRFHVKETT